MKLKPHFGHYLTFTLVALLAVIALLSRSVGGEGSSLARVERATGLHLLSGSLRLMDGGPGMGAAVRPGDRCEIVFLASRRLGAANDLYRAEVRLDAEGRPVSLSGLINLTRTPDGDDFKLEVAPPFAAVATRALGQIRSVTVLDFSGQRIPDDPESGWTPMTRALARVSDVLETGHALGLGKTTHRFTHPPSDVELTADPTSRQLALRWNDGEDQPRSLSLAPFGQRASSDELVAIAEQRLPKRPILWAVDTARSLSWIGPGPIEWLEGRFFALKDNLRRAAFAVEGDDLLSAEQPVLASTRRKITELPPGLEVSAGTAQPPWPPRPFQPTVFDRIAKGEGEWRPASPDFVAIPAGEPDIVYRSFTRPDKERPYVKVELFALDMRRLELHMVGGVEDPVSTTGSQGQGRFPRDPAVLSKVVAAFNGAFKTEHGAYGMMVDRDVLLPPKDGAATVASMSNGGTMMGTWPERGSIPDSMVSFRQNLEPLIEDGVVNPSGRRRWGFTVAEDMTNMYTIRSGLCTDDGGILIYAWGEEVSADTLAIAMKAAGCRYAMHLDMNPFHTAFVFYRFSATDLGRYPKYESLLAIPAMRYSPHRYVNGAPKDFFYLTLKDKGPGQKWSSEGLAQPAPAIVPAIFQKRKSGCDMIAVDLTRVQPTIGPGDVPDHLVPSPGSSYDPRADLVQIHFGPWSESRGQLVRGSVVGRMTNDEPTVAVDGSQGLAMGPWPISGCDVETADALQPSFSGAERAAAIGKLGKRWLIAGEGPSNAIAGCLKAEGAEGVAVLDAPDDGVILVRRQTGMSNLRAQPVTATDDRATILHLAVSPNPLGVVPLARAVLPGGVAVAGK